MVDKILYVVMVPMVYLAFAWCIIGIVAKMAKIAKAKKHPHTLQIFPTRSKPALKAFSEAFGMPTIRKKDPVFWVFLMFFHLGILLLLLSHLDLFPQVNIMSKESCYS